MQFRNDHMKMFRRGTGVVASLKYVLLGGSLVVLVGCQSMTKMSEVDGAITKLEPQLASGEHAQLDKTPESKNCKPTFTQVYQPPLKLGGVGRVILVPSGKTCGQSITKQTRNPYVDSYGHPYGVPHYPKDTNCPTSSSVSFYTERVDNDKLLDKNGYVEGRLIIRVPDSTTVSPDELLVPVNINNNIWEVSIPIFVDYRWQTHIVGSDDEVSQALAFDKYLRLQNGAEVSYVIRLPADIGSSFFSESGSRSIKVKGLKSRAESFRFFGIKEDADLSIFSERCGEIYPRYVPKIKIF
ncbi:MAG: hypothetical protein COA43_08115 [Robiginitomaculum sp.]|nr:MAG: hypothetical protein COA43_08115 [Robiginitomaculum sp.]